MSKLHIEVISAPDRRYVLEHNPIVALGDGEQRTAKCSVNELLACLLSAGYSKEAIEQGQRDIIQRGWTIFESSTISDPDLEKLLTSCEQEQH